VRPPAEPPPAGGWPSGLDSRWVDDAISSRTWLGRRNGCASLATCRRAAKVAEPVAKGAGLGSESRRAR
jgi:hypothetical protein